MEQYLNETLNAFGLLLRVGIIVFFFITSRNEAIESERPTWKVYLYRVVIILIVSVLTAYSLGSFNTSPDEPLFGQSEVIEYYEPTFEQKVNKFLFVFIVLIVPTIMGASDGLKQRWLRQNKSKNEL